MAQRRRKKPRKASHGALIFWAAVFVLLVAALAVFAVQAVQSPFGPETETLVRIAPGASTTQIARQLEQEGVLRTRYSFYLLRWFRRGVLKAGEYRFDHPATAAEVYSRIARGDVYTIALTVPEGANIFEVAARVEQSGLATRQDFLKAAVEQISLVGDIDPQARSLEGYLFPDTYRFSPPVSAAGIAAAMVRRFRVAAKEAGLIDNVHKTVTLASLVERETAIASERPLVASVYTNRLLKKMPLMADPSVIYGLELEGRWRGAIYASDLKNDTAYNTYLHAGLPPGPIANPGLPSLQAAVNPAQTGFLFFVAASASDPQGHSIFSATMDEQARNVAEYRKTKKRAGAR
jgi:UPF0755 protein